MTQQEDEERPGFRHRWARWRDRLRERRRADFVYRIVVGVVGLAVLAVGIVAIPYPGPGWAIVFIGLGILATEFDWARRLLAYAKERYDKAMDWFHARHWSVQVLGGIFTALIVAPHAVAARRARLDGGTGRHRPGVVEQPDRHRDLSGRTDSMVAFDHP